MIELIKPGDFITFNKEIFTTDYYDKEGDLPSKVKIISKTKYGILVFDNKIIQEEFTFNLSDVNSLKYIRTSSKAYTENIDFQLSDNNPNNLFSNMATFTINVNEYINLPPDQIGDNELTVENGQTIVFTKEDFTFNTTPIYDDPEKDPPYQLKILSLPSDGSELFLDTVPVVINQEILFTDIEDGLLTLEPTSNSDAHDFTFEFTISDTGSKKFYPV